MSSEIKTPEDNNLVPGDIIVTQCHTYEVQSLLGEGSFGKVVKCVRTKDGKTVAVKVLKKEGRYHDQAKAEVSADSFVWVCIRFGSATLCLWFDQLQIDIFSDWCPAQV